MSVSLLLGSSLLSNFLLNNSECLRNNDLESESIYFYEEVVGNKSRVLHHDDWQYHLFNECMEYIKLLFLLIETSLDDSIIIKCLLKLIIISAFVEPAITNGKIHLFKHDI